VNLHQRNFILQCGSLLLGGLLT